MTDNEPPLLLRYQWSVKDQSDKKVRMEFKKYPKEQFYDISIERSNHFSKILSGTFYRLVESKATNDSFIGDIRSFRGEHVCFVYAEFINNEKLEIFNAQTRALECTLLVVNKQK